jgi:hypothetical protein
MNGEPIPERTPSGPKRLGISFNVRLANGDKGDDDDAICGQAAEFLVLRNDAAAMAQPAFLTQRPPSHSLPSPSSPFPK